MRQRGTDPCGETSGTFLISAESGLIAGNAKVIHASFRLDEGEAGVVFNYVDIDNWWRVSLSAIDDCVSLHSRRAGVYKLERSEGKSLRTDTFIDVFIAFDSMDNVNVTVDFDDIIKRKNVDNLKNGGIRVGFYATAANANLYQTLVVAELSQRQRITPPTPAPSNYSPTTLY